MVPQVTELEKVLASKPEDIEQEIMIMKELNQNQWHYGSTPETVYDENGGVLGSLDPRESATPLYRKNGKLHRLQHR